MKKQTRKSILIALGIWAFGMSCQTVMNLSPIPTPLPPIVQKFAEAKKDGMTMVFVEEGAFIMGSNTGEANERPMHVVHLDSYWIDQTEVTNRMYRLCMEYGPCEAPFADGFIALKDHYTNPDRNDYPVTYVSWENANVYCEWAGRRLPTEAEWEKAARGMDGRIYPWGNNKPSVTQLNFNNTYGGLTKVGSFPLGASPYGALDMAGNVWEFVSDWYDEHYYPTQEANNPKGPSYGETRGKRGGAFFDDAYHARATIRNYTTLTYNRSGDLGFRCGADPNYFSGKEQYQGP